jgi:glycosyltransferase involved in cell wall biosynthesis
MPDIRFPMEMTVERTERPLRIAIVYGRVPLPMRRSDQMTVAHLLSFLKARGHSVDLYCFNTGAVAEPEDLDWLASACRNVFLYKHPKTKAAMAILRMLVAGVPGQVGLYSSFRQRRDLKKAVAAGEYDLLYTYYFRSAEISRGLGREPQGPALHGKPVSILAMQLSQTLNTRRIAKHAPNLLYKILYEIEGRLVADYETRIWREFTHNVLIGPRDLEEIQAECGKYGKPRIDNYFFGAHGTDVSRFSPRLDVPVKPNHLVFSGVMRTPTNIQAVQWFARNVWPIIRAERRDATWSIVGREPSSEVLELAKLEGVEVTGTVSDPAVRIAEAAVCIDPMQAGGGMQNKLIEFLASAKPVVSTSVANEGIHAVPGEHLLIADSPEEFARAVLHLLSDPETRDTMGARARQFVLNNWTWEAHFLELEKNFFRALDNEMAVQQVDVAEGAFVNNPAV